jgi:hypothetical protein
MRQNILGGFWPNMPRGNDPTLTIFSGWQDLNPPNVYTKYENNPFKIVVCSLWKPNSFRLRRWTGPQPKSGDTMTDFNPQRCILNMKTIPSKLWSVASRNQRVSGSCGVSGSYFINFIVTISTD